MSLETIAPSPAVARDSNTSDQQPRTTSAPTSAVQTIPVSGGPNALCDEEDFPFLSMFRWKVNKAEHLAYPTTHLCDRNFYMHHLVMLQPDKAKVYHRDGNRFNNCRANLCSASKGQISASAEKRKCHCSSIYKGVSWTKRRANWEVHHFSFGKTTYLGTFVSEEAAARAYDKAAYAAYGDFARLNFPRPKGANTQLPPKSTEETRPNWSLTDDGAIRIPTTNGPDAFCDADDLPFLSRLTWRVETVGDRPYAVACVQGRDVFMHHWVLRCTERRRLLHRDGNGLNNRRSNLLAASHPQIYAGKRNRKGVKSRFKGVTLREANRWQASIIVKGTYTNLGRFHNEEDAARAYDAAARVAFAPFAFQNFPEVPTVADPQL